MAWVSTWLLIKLSLYLGAGFLSLWVLWHQNNGGQVGFRGLPSWVKGSMSATVIALLVSIGSETDNAQSNAEAKIREEERFLANEGRLTDMKYPIDLLYLRTDLILPITPSARRLPLMQKLLRAGKKRIGSNSYFLLYDEHLEVQRIASAEIEGLKELFNQFAVLTRFQKRDSDSLLEYHPFRIAQELRMERVELYGDTMQIALSIGLQPSSNNDGVEWRISDLSNTSLNLYFNPCTYLDELRFEVLDFTLLTADRAHCIRLNNMIYEVDTNFQSGTITIEAGDISNVFERIAPYYLLIPSAFADE